MKVTAVLCALSLLIGGVALMSAPVHAAGTRTDAVPRAAASIRGVPATT